LQCDAVCCSVLQCVAVCCSVLQCVAVCCSVLQCVLQSVLHSKALRLAHLHRRDTLISNWQEMGPTSNQKDVYT